MRQHLTQNAQQIVIIGLLGLLPWLFFWQIITTNPADQRYFVSGDFSEQYFPLRAFSAKLWAEGRVPLWNPALYGGQPALADIQSGALYPPHVLQAWLLGVLGVGFPLQALAWQAIVHFMIAAWGSYVLAYTLAKQAQASCHSARLMGVVASLTFTYSGYLTGFPVQQVSILQVSAWLPWVMFALANLLHRLRTGLQTQAIFWLGATALFFAWAILAGHPQTVLYVAYLSLAYALFIATQVFFVDGESRKAIKLLLFWGGSVGLGAMIATAQLWPTLEFIRHSLRSDLPFQEVARGLPPSELASLIYPGYFGGSPAYIGLVSLVLIGAAVLLLRTVYRLELYFWLGVAGVSLIVALGANTFFYPLLYLALPGFSAVRQQERVFLLYALALAVVAGFGALTLSQAIPSSQRECWRAFQRNLKRLGGLGLLLLVLFVYGATATQARGGDTSLFLGVLRHHIFALIIFGGTLILLSWRKLWRRSWGIILVGTWLAFNLFTINWQFNLESRDRATPFVAEGVSLFLQEQVTALNQPVRIASGGWLAGGNNAASVYGLEDITGNTPLQLADMAQFSAQMPSWRFWQLLNVRFVLDERDITGPGLTKRFEQNNLKVYEVGDPLARAWLVWQVETDENWLRLADDEFDLKTTALLSTEADFTLGELDPAAQVQVLLAQAGKLDLQIETNSAAFVVISNVDYPGWQARLNNQPWPVYRTNGVLQGVYLPAGQHQLSMIYSPLHWRIGRWLSLLGIILAIACVFWPQKRK